MPRAIRVRNVAGTSRFLVAVPSVHISPRGFVTRGWRFKHHYILHRLPDSYGSPNLWSVMNLGDNRLSTWFCLQDAVSYLAKHAGLD